MNMEDSSSSSGSHYANLLSTISELRTDLDKTVSKMQILEEQNRNLQANYNSVKDELVQTRKKYVEARDNYINTAAAKMESERQSEAFLEKVKYQLTEKTKEFEQLREKFAPQDIDFVRIKVQEELEIPHRQKVQTLENEIERQKDLSYNMKRELEKFKAETSIMIQNYDKQLVAEREEYEISIQLLQKQITDMQFREYMPEKDDKIRNQKIKIVELDALNKTLNDEIIVLRQQKQDALHSLDMAKLRHTETYNEMKTKLITSDADKYSAEQRLSNMTISYQNLEMTSRTLRQNLEDKEREIWNLRQIVNDRENTIKTLKISHANEIESINTTNENEYQDMQNKIDDLREKINDREEMVKRIQRESSEMQLRAESINMEQRKTYTSQIHELRQKNEQLELNNIDTIDMMRSNKEKYDHQNELLSYDNDRLKSEVSRLQREKEVLHSQIQINEQKNSQEKQRVLQLKHVTDESNKSLKLQIQSLNDEIIALKSHIEKSKEEIRHLHDEQNVLNSKHEAALAAFSAESERKYENLGQTYRSQLEESKKKLMKVVMKERKRGDTYKDHAIEAHRRSKALTGAAMAVAAGEPFPKESLESY